MHDGVTFILNFEYFPSNSFNETFLRIGKLELDPRFIFVHSFFLSLFLDHILLEISLNIKEYGLVKIDEGGKRVYSEDVIMNGQHLFVSSIDWILL